MQIKDTLVRRLALAKLRELRRAGFSYRDIGLQFGLGRGQGRAATAGGFAFRLPPERLLAFEQNASNGSAQHDAAVFLRALDAVDQGLVFFTCGGVLLHANRAFSKALNTCCDGERLHAEVQHFASSLCGLVKLREYGSGATVEELALREVPLRSEHYRIKGSFIGLDIFGHGPSTLIALEKPAPDPLSDEALQERFALTRKEAGVLRLMLEGRSNEQIAAALFLSPHTVRHHGESIFHKLAVKTRTEAAVRVLRR